MEFMDFLKKPPREYTPVPFWFLNGDLREEELRRQLRDFDAHGVHGVVLHPRIGLSDHVFESDLTLFREALARLTECPCESGCPSCVGASVGPGAKKTLEELLGRILEARTEEKDRGKQS